MGSCNYAEDLNVKRRQIENLIAEVMQVSDNLKESLKKVENVFQDLSGSISKRIKLELEPSCEEENLQSPDMKSLYATQTPFGTLPSVPQLSRTWSAPSLQNGISSIPKHCTADAAFIPRENPMSLIIRPPTSASTPMQNAPATTPAFAIGLSNQLPSLFNTTPANGNASSTFGSTIKANFGAGESYIEAIIPKLRQSDYYTRPRIKDLAAMERSQPGYCRRVKHFVVGRLGYGSIKFFGETDVRFLDLDSIVEFNMREVVLYRDESKKPPVGQGLNKPAELTILNVEFFDNRTKERVTEGPGLERCKDLLKKQCEEQAANFLCYEPWFSMLMISVNHFSNYKFEVEMSL